METSSSQQEVCPVCGQAHEISRDRGSGTDVLRCNHTGITFVTDSSDNQLRHDDSPSIEEGNGSPQQDSDATLVMDTLDSRLTTLVTGDRPSVIYQLATHYHTDAEPSVGLVRVSRERYRLQKQIAAGGMGAVALTHDNDLNRSVAMKTILPRYQRSRRFVARFIREAQTVGQLEHPNIVPIYDMGMGDDENLYFTMRYIRGQTLEDVIDRLAAGDSEAHTRFSWARRANIIQHVCDALEFAHRRGVVHRDLKPENIMIGEFGEVLVMDWGISKLSALGGSDLPDSLSDEEDSPVEITELAGEHTAAGAVVGTPQYMSPEQAQGDETVGEASDIYALGAVMYKLFSLRLPHSGSTVDEVLSEVVNSVPPRVDSYRGLGQGVVPIEIHYIVSRAMSKDPAERHASAAELKHDIQQFIDGTYPIRCPHTALKRALMAMSRLVDNHAKLIIVVMLAAVAVLLGLLQFWLTR